MGCYRNNICCYMSKRCCYINNIGCYMGKMSCYMNSDGCYIGNFSQLYDNGPFQVVI